MLVSTFLVAGGYGLAQVTTSKWDDALSNADAEPMATATVERMDFIEESVSVAGEVRLGAIVPVGGSAPTNGDLAVVTRRTVQVGDELASGVAVVEISGRPVIALALDFPLYRDLTVGTSGPDVATVQAALSHLGLYRNAIDGIYGAGTSVAVEALYQRAGYEAPRDLDADSALDVAERALADAVRSVADGADASTVADAREVLSEARERVGAVLPLREVFALPGERVVVATVTSVGTVINEADGAVGVRSAGPTVIARATAAEVEALATGADVEVTRVGGSPPMEGVVASVGEFTSDTSGGIAGYDIAITLADSTDLRDGEPVVVEPADRPASVQGLGVPLTAVREDGDGYYVLVAVSVVGRPDARTATLKRVVVEPSRQQGGFVLVASDGLTVGDTVAIGDVAWPSS